MTTLKERLLAALDDVSWEDLPEAALVEVLIEQLKRAKADVFNAHALSKQSALRVNDMEQEIRTMRTNPLAYAHGDFYFADDNISVTYVVSIRGPREIAMYKRAGRIDYAMQRINVEEYARRSK